MARRLILGVLTALLGISVTAMAQNTEMTMKEYEAALAECRDRQRTADAERQEVEQRIADLRQQNAEILEQIATIEAEVLELVNADSTALRAYQAELDDILQQLRAMRQLSPNQIVDAREAGEIDQIEARLNELKKNLMAALPESQQKIATAERLIEELRNVQRPIPAVRRDQYTVVRGDHLWRIANRPTIYGNPYEWVKLYSANQDLVGDDPNLIYPDWVLGVPRNQAPGTHWVSKGESLHSISKKVYGDASRWTELYRANRDLIERTGGDEFTIYPHMILDVPQR